MVAAKKFKRRQGLPKARNVFIIQQKEQKNQDSADPPQQQQPGNMTIAQQQALDNFESSILNDLQTKLNIKEDACNKREACKRVNGNNDVDPNRGRGLIDWHAWMKHRDSSISREDLYNSELTFKKVDFALGQYARHFKPFFHGPRAKEDRLAGIKKAKEFEAELAKRCFVAGTEKVPNVGDNKNWVLNISAAWNKWWVYWREDGRHIILVSAKTYEPVDKDVSSYEKDKCREWMKRQVKEERKQQRRYDKNRDTSKAGTRRKAKQPSKNNDSSESDDSDDSDSDWSDIDTDSDADADEFIQQLQQEIVEHESRWVPIYTVIPHLTLGWTFSLTGNGPNVSHLTHNRQELNPQKFCVELFCKNITRNMCSGDATCIHGPGNDTTRQCLGPGCRHADFKTFVVEKKFGTKCHMPKKRKLAQDAAADTTPGISDYEGVRPNAFWHRIRIAIDPFTDRYRRMSLLAIIHEFYTDHEKTRPVASRTSWAQIAQKFSRHWRYMGFTPLDHFDMDEDDNGEVTDTEHNKRLTETVRKHYTNQWAKHEDVSYTTGKHGMVRSFCLENEVPVGDQILTISQIMHRCFMAAGLTSAKRISYKSLDSRKAAILFIPYWRRVLKYYPEIAIAEHKRPVFPLDNLKKLARNLYQQYRTTPFLKHTQTNAKSARNQQHGFQRDYTLCFRTPDLHCPGVILDDVSAASSNDGIVVQELVHWSEKVHPPKAFKQRGGKWKVEFDYTKKKMRLKHLFCKLASGKLIPLDFEEKRVDYEMAPERNRNRKKKEEYIRGGIFIKDYWWPLVRTLFLNLPKNRWDERKSTKNQHCWARIQQMKNVLKNES